MGCIPGNCLVKHSYEMQTDGHENRVAYYMIEDLGFDGGIHFWRLTRGKVNASALRCIPKFKNSNISGKTCLSFPFCVKIKKEKN